MKKIIKLIFTALLLATLAGMHAAESSGTKPTIFRAVDTVHPGEAVLLYGDWPVTATVEIAELRNQVDGGALSWQPLKPLQVSSQSMKFAIPANWAMGAYACRVKDGSVPLSNTSATVMLNVPDPWWLMGDNGATAASPGGWLRIFGKALHFDAPCQVRLDGANRKIELVAQASKDAGGYALTVPVPAIMPTGTYSVSVHNGFGGSDGWRSAGHIQIRPVQQRKKEMFDVTKFGATSFSSLVVITSTTSSTNDCTTAVKTALDKAKANGGGVVYFPRGRYVINDQLILPPFVTLKGEGEGLVSLYWPSRETPLDSLVSGTDDFAVEDLAIYTNGIQKSTITGHSNVRIQRVRIRANFYQRHDFIGKAHRGIPIVTAESADSGVGVHISGDNAVITDCDIYHSDRAIVLNDVFGGLIAHNRLDYGFSPLECYGISRVIIEDNECAGAALWASGVGLTVTCSCADYHVYFAHNHIRQVYGGDSECVTTDGHGTAYFGKIVNVQGNQVFLANDPWFGTSDKHQISEQNFQYGLKKWRLQGDFASEEWHGVTFYVLSGRGAGQYRNVIECKGKQITLDQPFAVPPDTSSVVSIGKFQGRHLFVGNEFRDGRFSVQLYAPSCDCIVAENQIWRTARMCSGASLSVHTFTSKTGIPPPQEGWLAQTGWFNQFLDNHIWEGNGWACESSVIEIGANVNVPTNAAPAFHDVHPLLGNVIRGNQLDNNAQIKVTGPVRDLIIEHNVVQNVEEGVTVSALPGAPSRSAPPEDVWIGDNTFKNVTKPVIETK